MNKSFRETLWFKKGELDASAAERAATKDDVLEVDAVDLLPSEDRYLDDGSVTREDHAQFSVRTGGTQMVPTLKGPTGGPALDVELAVAELKRGRRKVIAMIATSMLAVIAVVLLSLA